MLDVKKMAKNPDLIKEMFELMTDSKGLKCEIKYVEKNGVDIPYTWIEVPIDDEHSFNIFEDGFINPQIDGGVRITADVVLRLAELLKPYYTEEVGNEL